MKIEIKEILDANTIRITTPDERWYQYPPTKQWFASSTWISGYVPAKDLTRWVGEVGGEEANKIKTERGDFGSIVHVACEKLGRGGEVNHDDVFPDGRGGTRELTAEEYEAVLSFARWAKEVKPEFLQVEKTVFNFDYKYAGTLDLMAKIDGKVWLIDLKTSKNIYLSHRVQLSSYFHADGVKADKMAILQEDKFPLFLSAYSFWSEDNADVKVKQKDYPTKIQISNTPY
jgi:hypothetical protein